MHDLKHGLYLLAEILLRLCVNPRLRARLLSMLGAGVGRNARIYDCRFINLQQGFANLSIGQNVHVGTACLIDLAGPVRIGDGTVLSPRVNVISHSDAGLAHNSPLSIRYPSEKAGVLIGANCWIGANATILSGSVVGEGTVVGASALVKGTLDGGSVYVGVPARRIG
ncbi:MAG: acyltransferase [Xanthomonadales bacterium]|nr:acyltransferase [Xanthomonadales bacterium]